MPLHMIKYPKNKRKWYFLTSNKLFLYLDENDTNTLYVFADYNILSKKYSLVKSSTFDCLNLISINLWTLAHL